MPKLRMLALLNAALALACVLVAYSQDEQSLGEVARQSRLQKQRQTSDSTGTQADQGASSTGTAQAKTSKRVITNDEIPEQPSPPRAPVYYQQNQYANYQPPTYTTPANYVKHQILGQKRAIARQEAEIERVSSSIAGGSCSVGCGQWNERQRVKQEQVERMKQMLNQMKANLEIEQEMARRQGYGNSVYDP